MVKGIMIGFNPLDIVECSVDGVVYSWTKGDVFELMKVRDMNPQDGYYVSDIRSVEWTFSRNRRSDGDLAASYRTFRVEFSMVKEGFPSVGRLTYMDIDGMVVKMRDMKLGKVLVNQDA